MDMANRLRRAIPALVSLTKIAELGSINNAAEHLNVSQSSLSRSLSALEKELGVQLLQRNMRGTALTFAGNTLLKHSLEIDGIIKNAARDMEQFSGESKIILGATPLTLACYLPGGLDTFQKRASEISIHVVEDNHLMLLNKLQQGEIDIAICPVTGPYNRELKLERLCSIDLCVYCGPHHKLANVPKPRLGKHTQHWIFPGKGSTLHTEIGTYFASLDLPKPTEIIEMSSLAAIQLMVASSTTFLTVLPRDIDKYVSTTSKLKKLENLWSFGDRQLGLFFRNEQRHATATKNFIKHMKQHFGEIS